LASPGEALFRPGLARRYSEVQQVCFSWFGVLVLFIWISLGSCEPLQLGFGDENFSEILDAVKPVLPDKFSDADR
jgi:hypothetical protein